MFLAKHLRSENRQTLSVPKNKSAEFTDRLKAKKDKGNWCLDFIAETCPAMIDAPKSLIVRENYVKKCQPNSVFQPRIFQSKSVS